MLTYLENLTGKFFYFRIQTSLLCTYKSLCTQTFHFESCRVLFYGVWMECSLRSFFKSKWILSLHQGITVITRTPFGVSAPVHDSAHKIGRFKSPGLSVYVIIWPGVWAELRLWSQSSSLLPSVHNNLLKIILWKNSTAPVNLPVVRMGGCPYRKDIQYIYKADKNRKTDNTYLKFEIGMLS